MGVNWAIAELLNESIANAQVEMYFLMCTYSFALNFRKWPSLDGNQLRHYVSAKYKNCHV